MANGTSSSARVHDQLSHPVIDADGHWREPLPDYLEYLDDTGGATIVDRFRQVMDERNDWFRVPDEEKRRRRLKREMWWGAPANALDQVTIAVPSLYYERLDEFGIDFSILYPTLGLTLLVLPDDELRQVTCRALNRMTAALYERYRDRITPVAVIPTHTPEEGIDELRFSVTECGSKVALTAGSRMRSTEGDRPKVYLDTMGIDSKYDYDPFWQACVDLGIPVTDHSGSYVWPDRQSVHNFSFNHIGHFANSQHASCRATFLGGVVARFPTLRFGFLEGGVGWSRQLLCDLVGHYEKRNRAALLENLRPTNVDRDEFLTLYEKYASGPQSAKGAELYDNLYSVTPFLTPRELTEREGTQPFDDFEAAGVTSVDDLQESFCKNFYFGCEADDPLTVLAFDRRFRAEGGSFAELKPIFSSDIGHFDVVDMSGVLHEAWEMVEHQLIDEEAFKKFVFTNAAEMCQSMNPSFFSGTAIEDAVL